MIRHSMSSKSIVITNSFFLFPYLFAHLNSTDYRRNLPRAAMVGIFACTIIYVLANASYFVTLNSIEILNSPAIALVTMGNMFFNPIIH